MRNFTCLKIALTGLTAIYLTLGMVWSPTAWAATPPRIPPTSEASMIFEKSAKKLDLQAELPPAPKPGRPFEFSVKKPFQLPAELAQAVLWGAVAVVLIILALQVYRNVEGRSRSRRFGRQEPDIQASGQTGALARLDEAQLQADDLARQGLYSQAMHVLLLQTLNEMRRRLNVSFATSLTSREILFRLGLNPQGHAALADINGRVEFTHFGQYRAGSDDYLACRRSFEVLTGALGAGSSS